MTGGRVRVEGADRLAATSAAAARAMAHGFGGGEADAGRTVAAAVRGRTPRRSGRLASTVVADGGQVSAATSYAGAVEFGVGPRAGLRGGHNIRAARYMRGGMAAASPAVVAAVAARARQITHMIKGA